MNFMQLIRIILPPVTIFGTTALSWPLHAEHILKIGVIDTGYDYRYERSLNLCKDKSEDLTGMGAQDVDGHGTNVAGLLALSSSIPTSKFCIKVYKIYHNEAIPANVKLLSDAISLATAQGMQALNISMVGSEPANYERKAVMAALDKGMIIFVAAGNDAQNLDEKCNNYPGCYSPLEFMVGNGLDSQHRFRHSNYGNVVKYWEDGCNTKSVNGLRCGTSMASPIALGKHLKSIYDTWAKLGYK